MRSVFKPDTKGYADTVRYFGVKPGQSKLIPRTVGQVEMNQDGSLTVYRGSDASGPVVIEPSQIVIPPGHAQYEELIARVGGLKPGETKGIPPRP